DGYNLKYFFWGAYYKGLLLPNPAREEMLQDQQRAQSESQKAGAEPKEADLRRRARLDSVFYFDDLWNTCAYRFFSTVWTPSTAKSPLGPRRKYPDPDPGAPPMDCRYPDSLQEKSMASVKSMIADTCVKQTDGEWIENRQSSAWALFERSACSCYPEN